MSPALLDIVGAQSQVLGAQTPSLANKGQVSSSLHSSRFVLNDRLSLRPAMNPSNDVNFQFSASSTSKPETDRGSFSSIHGQSRPRIVKVRRSQHNRTMSGSPARKFDPALNRFSPDSDDCGGVSSDDGSSMLGVNRMGSALNPNQGGEVESCSILDDIKKLRLGDEKVSLGANGRVNGINERETGTWNNVQRGSQMGEGSADQLLNEIKRLNIQDPMQHEMSMSSEAKQFNLPGDSQTNVGFSGGGSDGDGYSRLVSGLPNDLKKLNIKDHGLANGNGLAFGASRNFNFEFGNRKKESDFAASSIADMITNKMKILDVKADSNTVRDKETETSDEKAMFDLGDSMILDELGKLKIGDKSKGVLPEGMGEKSTTVDVDFQGEGSTGDAQVPQHQSSDGTQMKPQFLFTSRQYGLGTPEFNSPSPEGNLFTARRKPVKGNLTRKMKFKPKASTQAQPLAARNIFPKESNFQHKQEPSQSYSLMEDSPYQESEHDKRSLRDTPTTSEESVILAKKEVSKGVGMEVSSEESMSAVKTESFKSANDFLKLNGEIEEVSSRLNDGAESSRDGQTQFFSLSSSEPRGEIPFKFSASSSGHVAPSTCGPKKKNRKKVGQEDPYNYLKNTLLCNATSTIHVSSIPRGSAALNTGVHHNEDLSNHHCKERPNLDVDKRRPVKQEKTSPSPTRPTTFAAKGACEKWRLRGNQAYSSGDLDKAEDSYTQGVNCIPNSEASRDELRALMLCYSNRAAVRMSLGRFRDALMDCEAAAKIDPKFFRVQVRKANCYLAVGEVAEASLLLMKLLQSGPEVCVDRKLIVEASESFQKAQKVAQCIDHSAELLRHKTFKDAESSLQAIEEALAISSYSEKLLQMKAEAFFMMRMYQEVIQLCEQTLQTAEKNFPLLGAYNESSNVDPSEFLKNHSSWVWRLSFIFSSYFYLGKLEEGLDFLEKQTDIRAATARYGPQVVQSLIPLIVPARELVKRKSAGNSAHQAGKHAEAVKHYAAALACNAESRPFAAICFGNRAAAYQSLGQIRDAIADCNLAIALDKNYFRAISRRATLFEMIRDYEEAASDLRLLISLLTKQAEENPNQPEDTDKAGSSQADLRQAQMRLSLMEEQAFEEAPLDFYLILGVEPSATSADLKKAYRKAALKLHPDKACQLLTRGENIDDGLWKEMSEEVQREAERLFKMIGEAYSVLSDPTKRFRYEEEVRNALKKPSGMGGSRMRQDGHSYGYQRSYSGRTARETWASSGNPHNRPYESSRSSRFN